MENMQNQKLALLLCEPDCLAIMDAKMEWEENDD